MCPLDIVPQSGPKGKCCPGKAKKDLPFSTNGLYYSVWEDFCPLRLSYGKPPPPKGEASFSILPWGGRFVSRESRMACLKLWAGKSACPLRLAYGKPPPPKGEASFRALHGLTGLFHVKRGLACLKLWAGKRVPALSGLPWASHLPQRRRRVFPPCLGFAGLFHVKHARLVLSRERERVPALSGLPMASHLPQRGRRVSAPCRRFSGLFHVKRKRQRSFRLAASPVGNE